MNPWVIAGLIVGAGILYRWMQSQKAKQSAQLVANGVDAPQAFARYEPKVPTDPKEQLYAALIHEDLEVKRDEDMGRLLQEAAARRQKP